MAITIQGEVGPNTLSDGAVAAPRLGRSGEVVVTELHGQFYEIVKRGNVYIAATGAAGVAPGTALSTTPPLTVFNPPASGVDLVILQAMLGYLSGTLGAGSMVWAVNNAANAAAPSGGTALTPINARISTNKGQGQAFQGATLPATPTILRPFCGLGPILATTAVQPWQIIEDLKGGIVIPSGCAASLTGIATAGTSPLVLLGCVWEEVPV